MVDGWATGGNGLGGQQEASGYGAKGGSIFGASGKQIAAGHQEATGCQRGAGEGWGANWGIGLWRQLEAQHLGGILGQPI